PFSIGFLEKVYPLTPPPPRDTFSPPGLVTWVLNSSIQKISLVSAPSWEKHFSIRKISTSPRCFLTHLLTGKCPTDARDHAVLWSLNLSLRVCPVCPTYRTSPRGSDFNFSPYINISIRPPYHTKKPLSGVRGFFGVRFRLRSFA